MQTVPAIYIQSDGVAFAMTAEVQKPVSQKRFRWVKKVALVLGIGAIGAWGIYWGHGKWEYPYGWSHCCSKVLSTALQSYAEDHTGKYPTGQSTPETSLSLLAKGDYSIDAQILRGKTVPLKVAEDALVKDGFLGPKTCGWHYIEGLTEADDPRIAILWDKVGLDHFGARLKGGGHEVVYLSGFTGYISTSRWPGFLEDQKQLLARRTDAEKNATPALTAKIKMPDGSLLDHYDGEYKMDGYSGKSPSLLWYRISPENGPKTYDLRLPEAGLHSKPVKVEIRDGRATPSFIIFEMEKD